MERRNFIKVAVVAGLGSSASRAIGQQRQNTADGQENAMGSMLPRTKDPGELRGEMLYRPLGRTGERVSAIGLGGSHIGKPALSPSESIRLIQQAIDRGITFMDNSWDYNEGQSELRMVKRFRLLWKVTLSDFMSRRGHRVQPRVDCTKSRSQGMFGRFNGSMLRRDYTTQPGLSTPGTLSSRRPP
jgi:hypothetical protein